MKGINFIILSSHRDRVNIKVIQKKNYFSTQKLFFKKKLSKFTCAFYTFNDNHKR